MLMYFYNCVLRGSRCLVDCEYSDDVRRQVVYDVNTRIALQSLQDDLTYCRVCLFSCVCKSEALFTLCDWDISESMIRRSLFRTMATD